VPRYNSPEGKLTAINATLVGDTSRPGHFLQSFPFGPAGDYNLIYLSEDYAMEYDCTEQLGVTNYCVHIMSRNRT
jgi:apolipoprotein D and lipocalin family protein